MKLNITAIADRMIWFITLIFLVLSLTISFALGDANYGAYVLFVCLFGLIIFYLIREQGVIKFRLTWMHGYMLLFIGACYLSTINAIEPSVALSRSFDIVKIFFMLIILYMCYQDKTSVDTLLKIGMWTGYIVCFYTVYFYGLDYFITVLSSSARIANDALNANTVGLLGANAIVMTLYYMLYDRPRWWNIIALPTLGILAATGSRKALVFVVVGTVLLFVFKSLRSANVVNSIAKIIGSLLALTIIGIAVLQLPMFSEVYSESKRLCECYCKSYAVEFGVPAVIARLAQTFGPGVPVSDNRVFMQFTKSALRNENIILHTKGDSMSNYCYITDALTGILTLMKDGEVGEAYNICHDEETRSIASIAHLVATHVSHGKSEVVFDIPEDVQGLGYAPTVHMFLSSKKLKSLGWQPKVSMAQAYVRLAEYIQEEGL